MKKNVYQTTLLFFSIVVFMTACIGNSNKDFDANKSFKSKEDSIDFAKKVIAAYPEIQVPIAAEFGKKNGVVPPKFNGIDYQNALNYASNYMNAPLIANKHGFLIDQTGFSILKSNSNYKQLFLCFGKFSPDQNVRDDYTIMIIPLNADTSVIYKGAGSLTQGQNSNYDYLDPCPNVCPKGFN